jgi:uncharacterized coiled-coil DUF342 family protein
MAKKPNQEVQLANARDAKASKDLDRYYAQLKQMNIAKELGVSIDEQEVKLLKEKIALKRKEVKATEEAGELAKTQFEYYDDILSIAGKINKNFEKTNSISSKVGDQFNVLTGYAGELAKNLKEGNYYTKEGADAAKNSAIAMESYSSSVSSAMREFKKGNMSADSLVNSLQSAEDALSEFIDDLDDSNTEIAKLKEGLVSSTASAKDLSKAFAESKKELSEIKGGLGDLASGATSAIPGLSGMGSAIANMGSLGVIGGILALGAAFHQLLGWYMDGTNMKDPIFGLNQVGIDMAYDMATGMASLNQELTQTSLQLGQNIQLSGAARANMMKLGVSGQEFADATKYSSNNLGLMGKNAQEVGADMAMYAKRTGTSADQLGSIANTFRIVGNLSGKAAANTLGMAESVAKTAGLPVNALFEDLAESSELLLQNNYGNEQSLIKQVASLRVMGVAAQKVLQAGQNMVLNYKDSIKAEMRLSALLGKQVDLSRVRQKFASGDAAGAADLLRTQLKGIDMDKMNMFQRQALQDATGMDMDTVMKLGKGGKGGPLQTDQEKMVGSISQLGNTFDNVMKKYIGDGVTIKGLSSEAAAAYWAAEAAKKGAFNAAQMQKDIDETKMQMGRLLITAGLILAAIGVAGLFGKGPAKFLGEGIKKLFTKSGSKAASTVVAKTGSQFAGGSFSAGKKMLAEKATSSVGKSVASNSVDDVAKVGLKSVAKGGFKGIMGGLGKGLLKGGLTGLLGTAASMAGDYFGGQREQQGMAEGDRSKVNQGKAVQAGATALEYAGYGAALGSIVPGIGTAVGGAVGGVVGGIKGIFDNWFSEDAKKKEEQLKKAEEQQKVIVEQKALSERDIATQEQMKSQSQSLAAAAQDTGFWQSAVVAQLVEATRLLDIIAFSSDDVDDTTKEIYLDGKRITRLNYDRASTLYNTMSTQKAAAK